MKKLDLWFPWVMLRQKRYRPWVRIKKYEVITDNNKDSFEFQVSHILEYGYLVGGVHYANNFYFQAIYKVYWKWPWRRWN